MKKAFIGILCLCFTGCASTSVTKLSPITLEIKNQMIEIENDFQTKQLTDGQREGMKLRYQRLQNEYNQIMETARAIILKNAYVQTQISNSAQRMSYALDDYKQNQINDQNRRQKIIDNLNQDMRQREITDELRRVNRNLER